MLLKTLILALLLQYSLSLDEIFINVTKEVISEAIRPDFASFSYEVPGILSSSGIYPAAPKASFLQLLKNLKKNPDNSGPNLRIGGNTADTSWWNPDNLPRPPNITYDIGPPEIISVGNVAKAVNGSIVFDLNFRQPDSAAWAVNHVQGIVQHVGLEHVLAFEIGNECDAYTGNGIRDNQFDGEDYQTQWELYATAISKIPGVPKRIFQGATFCCRRESFDSIIPNYVSKFKQSLISLSYHRYPGNHCNGRVATMEALLSDSASQGQANTVKPFAEACQAQGVDFVVGEGNSVACGGMPGVSNVFGSALWAIDFMFNMAAINTKRVNFHGGGEGVYTAIGYKNTSDPTPDVRPLYYAMWLISDVTGYDAVILKTNVTTSNPLVKTWTVKNSKGQTYVVVIHKDLNAKEGTNVIITPATVPKNYALLTFLKAEGVDSPYGISYATQTFDGSKDGLPVGSKNAFDIYPTSPGFFLFYLPPLTVAVLELPLP